MKSLRHRWDEWWVQIRTQTILMYLPSSQRLHRAMSGSRPRLGSRVGGTRRWDCPNSYDRLLLRRNRA
jgi:hypothetical protein